MRYDDARDSLSDLNIGSVVNLKKPKKIAHQSKLVSQIKKLDQEEIKEFEDEAEEIAYKQKIMQM